MRSGYTIDMLTSDDIQEIIKNGGKMIQIYEGIIYRENFKISPIRKVKEKFFALGQNYKDEHKNLMQGLVILMMNCLYEVRVSKDKNDSYHCKSEQGMETEFDENILD